MDQQQMASNLFRQYCRAASFHTFARYLCQDKEVPFVALRMN